MPDDLYSQFGVSPKDYFIDPDTNTIKNKEFALPTEMPVEILQPTINDYQTNSGTTIGNKLFGTGGEERYQTWPERIIRSGSTIAGDVFSGAVPVESSTGYPGSVTPTETQMEPNAFGKALGIGNFTTPTANSEIGRAQDMAGMAGMSSIPLAEKGALGAIGGKFNNAAGEGGNAGFYSTLENTIANSKVQKATPEQWTSYLKNQPGIKPEELEFSLQGLGDKPLTKEQLAQHVADNGIKLGEVVKGNDAVNKFQIKYDENSGKYNVFDGNNNLRFEAGDQGQAERAIQTLKQGGNGRIADTKYSSYQLPGGDNYRELLMTLEDKAPINKKLKWEDLTKEEQAKVKELHDQVNLDLDPQDRISNVKDYYEQVIGPTAELQNSHVKLDHYRSSHWDEPNVLAHIRMNDREVPGVGKTLHVEEIQSDWHQAGRKSGYKGQDLTPEDHAIRDRIQNNKATEADYAAWENGVGNKFAKDTDSSRVPNAPFKKTWDELALKRVINEAVNKGYDAVSWTPGEAQAARYDLSKQVDKVNLVPDSSGQFRIDAFKDNKKVIEQYAKTEQEVATIVGKEVAEKLFNTRNNLGASTVAGQDLKVGGEGMKAFYDKMLVDKANALVKKMGGKVEYYDLPMSYDPKKPPKSLDEVTDVNQKIPIIKITPAMCEQISQKGFPLYSSGVPIFTPVDHDPHKMTPINYNPFTNSKAM